MFLVHTAFIASFHGAQDDTLRSGRGRLCEKRSRRVDFEATIGV